MLRFQIRWRCWESELREGELVCRSVWCGHSGLCARVVGGRRVGLRRGGRATGIVSSRRSRGRNLVSGRGPLNVGGGADASMWRFAAELPECCVQYVCTECGGKIEGVLVCSASVGVAGIGAVHFGCLRSGWTWSRYKPQRAVIDAGGLRCVDVVNCGSRLGRWRRKCLHAAFLHLCPAQERKCVRHVF